MNIREKRMLSLAPTAILALGLFLSPILFVDLLFEASDLPRNILISFLAVTLFLFMVREFWIKSAAIRWHPVNYPIIVLMFLSIVSGLWAIDRGAYYLYIIPFTGSLLIYFAASQLSERATLFLSASLLGAGYAAMIGIAQKFNLDPFNYRYVDVVGSTFNYKNNAAIYMDMIIPSGISLILVARTAWLRYLLTVPCAICISYLLETKNRGSYFALTATLIFVVAFLMTTSFNVRPIVQSIRRSRVQLIILLLVVLLTSLNFSEGDMPLYVSRLIAFFSLILMLGLIVSIPEALSKAIKNTRKSSIARASALIVMLLLVSLAASNIGKQAQSMNQTVRDVETWLLDTSLRERYATYTNALAMYNEKPILGVGFGGFWKAFREHTNAPIIIPRTDLHIIVYRAHNEFLQVLIELGVIGAIVWVITLIAIIWIGFRAVVSASSLREQILCLGIVASVLATCVHSLVDFPFHKPSSNMQFWMLAGLIVGVRAQRTSISGPLHKSALAVGAMLVVGYLLASGYLYEQHARGSYYHQKALLEAERGDCREALEDVDLAIANSPYFVLAHTARIDVNIRCQKDRARLLAVLEEELNWDQNFTQALLKRAYLKLEETYFKTAQKDFERLDMLLPHRPYGRFGQAEVLLQSGKLDEGIKALKELIADYPTFTAAQELLRNSEAGVLKKNRQGW